MNGSMLLYNASLLGNAAIDPKSLTTLDAIVQAAAKLVQRDGGNVTRAGLLPFSTPNLITRWILDQGGKFYAERNHKWMWQTAHAERAIQWILDHYHKHGVAWRKQPEGVKDALGEGHAAMATHGAYARSGYAANFPDVRLEDQPLPGFVPEKQAHYYEPEIAGYSLSALLKPDDPKAKIGAAFYKHLLSPDSAIALANVYSGAILIKDVYTDPRFKQTKFGTVRAKLPEQIISKAVLIPTSANPYTIGNYMTKVIAGELSIKTALAEAQQKYDAEEEEARRNMD